MYGHFKTNESRQNAGNRENEAQHAADATKGQPEVESAVRDSLASSYLSLGRPIEAEREVRAALALRDRLFGRQSAETAASLGLLSLARYQQNDLEQAVSAAREAVAICRAVLPGDHLELATSLECLAKPLTASGHADEAQAAMRESLAIIERLTGPASADTARAISNLAATLVHDRSKAAEARQLLEHAVEINTRQFGQRHFLVARNYRELADLQYIGGDRTAAEKSYLAAIEIGREVLGPEHTDVLGWQSTLAFLYGGMKRFDDAAQLLLAIDAAEQRIYGPDSSHRLRTLMQLADVRDRQGRAAEAESIFRDVLARTAHAPDANAYDACTARTRLAEMLVSRNEDVEAESLLTPILSGDVKSDSPAVWVIPPAQSLAGEIYRRRGEFDRAEPLLVAGAEGLAREGKLNPNRYVRAIGRVIQLFEQRDAAQPGQGYAERAAQWRARRDAATQPSRPPG